MSGKKAKEARREEKAKGPPPPVPKVLGQITISYLSDNSVTVFPLPESAMMTQNIMLLAQVEANKHFLDMAVKGKLDNNFNVKKSLVLKPKEASRIIVPGGEDNIIVPG